MDPVLKDYSGFWPRYTGTGHSDVLTAAFHTELFGLQGDDQLNAPVLAAGVEASADNSGAILIGGQGNDTYYVSGPNIVDDSGGGVDKIVFREMSYQQFLEGKLQMYSINNQHIFMGTGEGYEYVFILNYNTADSAIERIGFNDGSSISFQEAVKIIISNKKFVDDVDWNFVVSKWGNEGTSFDYLAKNSRYNFRDANTRFESEADFSRDASVSDAQTVARIYKAALDRAPDASGLNSWIDNWENNWTEQSIAQALLTSNEYLTTNGTNQSDQQFVEALYQNALNREPDTDGMANWVNSLSAGEVTRADVLLSVSQSEESVQQSSSLFANMSETAGNWSFSRTANTLDVNQIARLYKAAFNRNPDSEGLNYWVNQWESGLESDKIADQFVDSAEFSALYTATSSDSDFVQQLYRNALGREADETGLAHWTGQLQQGTERSEVLTAFSESTENQNSTSFKAFEVQDTWYLF